MSNNSFSAVKDFISFQNNKNDSQGDRYYGNCNVVVDQYLYKDVNVYIYYQTAYMDYRIEITWEEDPTQPTYDSINLHGYYSTNFQTFVFDEGSNNLSFMDGEHNISIHPL
ncbi:hypothetical protein SAMN02910447_00391 [Ruminococcus sp. YE71]|uniref:hypothetical protein n=1 Tax=unclassified Ruminococcus TaxID=2608920 RepID=UPI000884730C|nr:MULTISPECIES: hypothetical protein [unclassified Ruminococcus]SDA11297.1 hypothetical protein SAMN02910446_00390 [Ruminococcus sp. YE78]SFW15046.1 hypothetical protein SAMN02910447_00391 [Ruminococcus sp. YE71]